MPRAARDRSCAATTDPRASEASAVDPRKKCSAIRPSSGSARTKKLAPARTPMSAMRATTNDAVAAPRTPKRIAAHISRSNSTWGRKKTKAPPDGPHEWRKTSQGDHEQAGAERNGLHEHGGAGLFPRVCDGAPPHARRPCRDQRCADEDQHEVARPPRAPDAAELRPPRDAARHEALRASRRVDERAGHPAQHREGDHVAEAVERQAKARDPAQGEGPTEGRDRLARGNPARDRGWHAHPQAHPQRGQSDAWPEPVSSYQEPREPDAQGRPQEGREGTLGGQELPSLPRDRVRSTEGQELPGVNKLCPVRRALSHRSGAMAPRAGHVNATSERGCHDGGRPWYDGSWAWKGLAARRWWSPRSGSSSPCSTASRSAPPATPSSRAI